MGDSFALKSNVLVPITREGALAVMIALSTGAPC